MPYANPEKRAAYQKAYSNRNRLKLNKQVNDWKRNNPVRVLESNSRSHYKRCSEDVTVYFKYLVKYSRRRRPDGHTITYEHLLKKWRHQEGRCALTGILLTHEVKANGGKPKHTNISIDRIDASQPYTPENTQLVCWIVNVMRRDMTPTEFVSWCEKVVRHNNERNHHAPRPSEPET